MAKRIGQDGLENACSRTWHLNHSINKLDPAGVHPAVGGRIRTTEMNVPRATMAGGPQMQTGGTLVRETNSSTQKVASRKSACYDSIAQTRPRKFAAGRHTRSSFGPDWNAMTIPETTPMPKHNVAKCGSRTRGFCRQVFFVRWQSLPASNP